MKNGPPKIEKGIPIPVAMGGSSFAWMMEMEVGDSSLLKEYKTATDFHKRAQHMVRTLKAKSVKFASRKAEGGVRVWRIA